MFDLPTTNDIEGRKRHSEAMKTFWANPENRKRMLSRIRDTPPNRTTFKKGSSPWNKGKKTGLKCHSQPHSEETKQKISESSKKMWETPGFKEKMSEIQSSGIHAKENNSNWQGGITAEQDRQRSSPEMATWRNYIFERDDYTCQECLQYGGDLRAHHIKSFAGYPHLRFQTWNGITLCAECHRRYHGGIG